MSDWRPDPEEDKRTALQVLSLVAAICAINALLYTFCLAVFG